MKLVNMRISTQLYFGLGSILVFVTLLGAIAYLQMENMWQQTQGLYEHPLMVRRALGELRSDILSIHLQMEELLRAENETETQTYIQNIALFEANADQQMALLYNRYLGPRSDVDQVQQLLVQWKSIRDETLRLLRTGNLAEASNRVKPTGVSDLATNRVLQALNQISDFAVARGDLFYQDAQKSRDDLLVRLAIVVAVILVLTLGISYSLQRSIQVPLQELSAATEQYRQGNLHARSRYVSENEFGIVSASFNNLAATIQQTLQGKEKVTQIAEVMLREDDLHVFCHELLKVLLEQTGSQVGAVYLVNEAKTHFEHIESIGLNSGKRVAFSAAGCEGEFGVALATRQIQRIAEIPADTRFSFAAVTGEFHPREIITIPILADHTVVAMISLASLQTYSAPAIQLVNDIWSVLNARLNGVLVVRQIRDFSAKLEHQNQELEAQKKELAVQADELSEQNIELAMQKKQLDEANRLKSVFLSNMSHELRTPLNSVIALTGVLNRRLRNTIPEEEYSYLDIIERNGKNLLALINDILDLSRIEAGRDEITLDHFSVRELIGEVITMIEPQAREKNIALVNHVGASMPIHSDFVKCRHILQNIMANAVKFTRQGTVEVSAESVGEDIEISVTDTGVGIAADQLKNIFDEFRQADESTARKFGGSGLGLAIAKKYALMLGGNITVASTPDTGSTFTIHLPLSPGLSFGESKVERLAKNSQSAQVDGSVVRGKQILIVEDSEPAVIQLTDMLAEEGYQVLVARNGKRALDQMAQSLPDAMILDLMMPEVDGFQVLQTIRANEATAQIPILILTAKHITQEDLKALKGNHIYQLIQKGDVSKTQLLAAIQKMVSPSPAKVKPVRTPLSGKPVVLIVEDNVDNLKTVTALLQDTCTILQASDGSTGIAQAEMHMPHLILLDISLPVIDGFKTLDAIRANETLQHIPVIALTARAMKGDREEILANGFDGYVSKPIDADGLNQTIQEVLYGK